MAATTAKSFRCDNHPPMSSRQYCAGCNKNLCGLCLELTGDYYTCKNCQRPCREAPRERAKGPGTAMVPPAVAAAPSLMPSAAAKSGPKTATLPPPGAVEPGAKLLSKMRGGGTNGPATATVAAPGAPPPTARPDAPAQGAPTPGQGIPFGKHFKLANGHMACRTHTQLPAARRCVQCDEYICMDCTKRVGDEAVCGECSGQVVMLAPQEQGIPVKDLMEYVTGSIAYPFTGDGIIILVVGGVLCWLLSWGGLISKLLGIGFLMSYMMNIIRTSAVGKEKPPGWPAFNPVEFLTPLWHCFLTSMAAFLPTLVVVYLMFQAAKSEFGSHVPGSAMAEMHAEDDDTPTTDVSGTVLTPAMKRKQFEAGIAHFEEWEMGPPTGAPPDWKPPPKPGKFGRMSDAASEEMANSFKGKMLIYFGLLLAGLAYAAIYYPMALLAVTLYRNTSCLSPLFVASAIVRTGPVYILPVLALAGMMVMQWVSEAVLNIIPIFGSLITMYVGLYLLMVQGRILGCVYWTKQKDLGWFT